jgi:hypothetical protein
MECTSWLVSVEKVVTRLSTLKSSLLLYSLLIVCGLFQQSLSARNHDNSTTIRAAGSVATSSSGAAAGSSGVVLEYCEGETFSARCGEDGAGGDAVILMMSAHYGRMRLARCLTANYGNVGCQLDVTSYFDAWCSGRRTCDVRVSSIIDSIRDNTFPCIRDFRGYLEASYRCVRVATRRREDCVSSAVVDISSAAAGAAEGGAVASGQRGDGVGYLASVVTEETGCGSLDTPWLLRTLPGQTIRLRLLDFESASRQQAAAASDGIGTSQQQQQRVCQVYAIIKEKSTTRTGETVCASSVREALVYSSVTNSVEVRIVSARKNHKNYTHFLLKYEAVGCPDPMTSSADNAAHWMERNGDIVTFGCNGSSSAGDFWQLKCDGEHWLGSRRNCSLIPPPAHAFDFNTSVWNVFTGSQWAALFIVLAIALAIGMVIFFIGLFYIKRRRSRQLSRASRGAFGSGAICGLTDYHAAAAAVVASHHCPEHGHLTTASGGLFHHHHQHHQPSSLPGLSKAACGAGGGLIATGLSPTNSDPSSAVYAACPSTENDYFQTWQLQRHAAVASCTRPPRVAATATSRPGPCVPRSVHPPTVPSCGGGAGLPMDSGSPSSACRPVVEHIYESPKFDRKDFATVPPSATGCGQPQQLLQQQECTCCVAITAVTAASPVRQQTQTGGGVPMSPVAAGSVSRAAGSGGVGSFQQQVSAGFVHETDLHQTGGTPPVRL